MTKKTSSPAAPPVLNVRASTDIIDRADALITFVTSKRGKNASRSDVVREALLRGLASMERESGRDAED